jgi:hypothetical protein
MGAHIRGGFGGIWRELAAFDGLVKAEEVFYKQEESIQR